MLRKSRPAKVHRRDSKKYRANFELLINSLNVSENSSEDEHKSDGHDSDEDRVNVDSRPPILEAAPQSHHQSPFMTPKIADRDQVLFTPSRRFMNN